MTEEGTGAGSRRFGAMVCPHCGSAAPFHYREAKIRHGVRELRGKTLVLERSERAIFAMEPSEVACGSCGGTYDIEFSAVEFSIPRFELEPVALRLGFEHNYGGLRSAALSVLPVSGCQSFAGFAEAVVAHATGAWRAIACPAGVRLRLVALFPYGESLCPMVQIGGREESIAGTPFRRREVEHIEAVHFDSCNIEAARVLCERTVAAANELLRQPSVLVELDPEWAAGRERVRDKEIRPKAVRFEECRDTHD